MKLLHKIIFSLLIILTLSVCVLGADFEMTKPYPDTFSDVNDSHWFSDSVEQVYRLGLMDGVSDELFDTTSHMTVAQAITVAARLHSIYNDKTIPVSGSANWYDGYVNYLIDNKVISSGDFKSFDRPVYSYEMVQLYARALPKEFFPAKNDISYIQDVPENMFFHDDVLLFYRAGILNGNDDYGTFLPTSYVTRTRGAAILARVALPESRLSFKLLDKRTLYSVEEALTILEYQTSAETLDDIALITIGDYAVTASEYRYYMHAYGNDKEKIKNALLSNYSILAFAKKVNVSITHPLLENMLTAYYTAKLTGGADSSAYVNMLTNECISDRAYAKLVVTSELIPYCVSKQLELITPQAVYQYAVDNGYICVKHIFISGEMANAYTVIGEVQKKLLAGEDFDALLDTYGMDTSMKNRPFGMVITKNSTSAAFEKAAFALEENTTSGIVRTESGYHIIKRIPYSEESLSAMPEYATIGANAAVELFGKSCQETARSANLSYIQNFDAITAILD